MEQIYRGDYCSFSYDNVNDILSSVWSEKTGYLIDEEFKDILLNIEMKFIKKYKPKGYFIDTRNYSMPIAPTLQEWIVKNIFAIWPIYGVKKVAFMTSTEFIADIALQQLISENTNNKLEIEYFDNEDIALNWLTKYH